MWTRDEIPYRDGRDDAAGELLSWARLTCDDRDIKTATHIATDPVTGEVQFSLYTDDGNGNGEGIVTIGLQEMVEAVRAYYAKAAG